MKTSPKGDNTVASRFGKVGGKKLHYLSGTGACANSSARLHPDLADVAPFDCDKLKDRLTVIAPDLPGIGHSDIPKDGCDMKTAATRIHALAKAIGATTARVVGHDIGLMVAYVHAAQFLVMDAFLPGVAGWGV